MKINVIANNTLTGYVWKLRSNNGQLIATSTTYARRMGAVRSANRLIEACKPGEITFVEARK